MSRSPPSCSVPWGICSPLCRTRPSRLTRQKAATPRQLRGQNWLYLYSLPILWSNYPCLWRSCCHCWELLYAGFQSVEPLATVCNDFKSMLLACCCFFPSNQYAWNNLLWCCGVSSYAVLACMQVVDVRMRPLTFLLLPLFLNISLFRDFKWTTTYGCILEL